MFWEPIQTLKTLLPNQSQQGNVITWFLIFCKSNEFFLKKTVTKYLFSYLFFTVVDNFKPKKKRLITACVFECFQSHCHILKELHNFLPMMGAIIIFGESIFIFSFVIMNLITKSVALGADLRRWQRKQNVKRWMWAFWLLQPN